MAIWAIVPAAGSGKRMEGDRPKQYLLLNGRPIISHTLDRLSSMAAISGLVVPVSAGDEYWSGLQFESAQKILRCEGGAERNLSVLNGLAELSSLAQEEDWVLVHDAVRPCVRIADIERLLTAIATHPVGGLLGMPVSSTLKRIDAAGNVESTIDRSGVWMAATPQIFRYGLLRAALLQACKDGIPITDESGALEHAGFSPLIISGRGDNIKITYPQDIELAVQILIAQAAETEGSSTFSMPAEINPAQRERR
jgi:2-C-methyl-D-erythritol 4-phosphate cytidylyltransferase